MNLTKSRTAKFVAGLAGFAIALSFVVTPVTTSAATIAELQAMIASLSAQLAALSGTPVTTTGYQFNTNLTLNSKGTDVLNLQKALNFSADTQVALTGAGSPGNETSFFGVLTKQAVSKFQVKYGITPTAGYFGPITRAKLNTMSGVVVVVPPAGTTLPAGCTSTVGWSPTTGVSCSTGTTLPTGGSMVVTAGAQPANSLAPESAARLPFTNFTVQAGSSDVTINSVTVARVGLASDAVFTGVVLLKSDGTQIGIAKTFNSNHQTNVGEPYVVRAGTTEVFTIAGNMATVLDSYAGQVVALNVVAINTSATVTGSLPITGAMHTINMNLAIGSVTVNASSYDPVTANTNLSIGTTGFRFSGLRISAGSAEDVTLKSIRWNQTGSAGSTDLANVVTFVNGTSYPTTISADGKYFTTVFATGIVIAKGMSVDAYIQGDVVGSGASGRTVEFDIYKNTDLYLVGNTFGYGVTAPVGVGVVLTALNHATVINTSSNPWFQGSNHSVTGGSVTLISKANEVASQNIAVNVPGQVLGGFATNFAGEAVSVQSMYFAISTTSGSLPTTANSPYSAITSISLVDENGAVVAGPVDAVVGDAVTAHGGTISVATSYAIIHFTDSVTFPLGRHVYTLKGTIPAGWASGTVVNIYTTPVTDWTSITGQVTGNAVAISTLKFNMNQMTVKGAALSVNISAQPTAQTIVAGVQGFTLANYTLDASASGEDVRLSAFPVKITDTTLVDLSGCQLWNGATALNTGSRTRNMTTAQTATVVSYSFDNSLVVPKGTTVTLALKCNIASGATNSAQVNYAAYTDFTVTGQTSGNSVVPTVGTANGGLMTISSGSLAISVDDSSPAYSVVTGGSTGIKVAVIKLRASNEDVTVNKIGLKMSGGTSSDVVNVVLKNAAGATIGTAQFAQGATPSATSTLITALNVPKDTDVLVSVYADFAGISVSSSGTEGMLVYVNPENVEANGQSSGETVSASQSTAVAGVRTFRSYPTVALDTLATNGLSDGRLMRFKITANAAGPVGINRLTFTVSTSSVVTLSNVALYAFTDSGYSSPISGEVNGQVSEANLLTTACTGVCTSTASLTTLVAVPAGAPIQVPAGLTVYFELRASVSGGSTTGASVVTTLKGDSTYITAAHLGPVAPFLGVSSTTGAVADGATFVWSGNATTTGTLTNMDWMNSSGLPGYSSSGFVQTRGI